MESKNNETTSTTTKESNVISTPTPSPALTLKATAKEFVPGGGFKPPQTAPVAMSAPSMASPQQMPVYAYGQMSYVPNQPNMMYPPQMMMMGYPNNMVVPVYQNNFYPGVAPPYMAVDPQTGLPIQIQQYPMPSVPQQQQQRSIGMPVGVSPGGPGGMLQQSPQQGTSPNPYNINKNKPLSQTPQTVQPPIPMSQTQTSQQQQTLATGSQQPHTNNNQYSKPNPYTTAGSNGATTLPTPPTSTTLVSAENSTTDIAPTFAVTETTQVSNTTIVEENVTNSFASFSFTNDDYHNDSTSTAPVTNVTLPVKSNAIITAEEIPTFLVHSEEILSTSTSTISSTTIVTAATISDSDTIVFSTITASSSTTTSTSTSTAPLSPNEVSVVPTALVPAAEPIVTSTETVTVPPPTVTVNKVEKHFEIEEDDEEIKTESTKTASISLSSPDLLDPSGLSTNIDKSKDIQSSSTATVTSNTVTVNSQKPKLSSAEIFDSLVNKDKKDSGKVSAKMNLNGNDSVPVTPSSNGGSSGWRRAETTILPSTILGMLAVKDGIIRYDKMSIVKLNKRNKLAPKEIAVQYPFHSQKERFPFLPRGVKDPDLPVDEGTQEEFQALFKGTGFAFDPTRLANTDDPDVVIKKANLILNKLSLTNFDKLSDEFMAVGIVNNDETLNKAIDLIVLKAQMEEHFCFMYADLCRKMIDLWSNEDDILVDKTGSNAVSQKDDNDDADEGGAANNGKPMSLGTRFRFQLLERCRLEFEIDRKKQLQDVLDMDIAADIKLEKEIILKKRYNGHMRFIGEIYMKDLVKPKIMRMCLDSLLDQKDEESLVCLCKLLRTIGLKLEQYDDTKRRKNVKITMAKVADLITNGIIPNPPPSSSTNENSETTDDITAEPVSMKPVQLSSRIKFMLQDVIDMWKDGWKARIEEAKVKKIGSSGAQSSNDLTSMDNQNQSGQSSKSGKSLQGNSSGGSPRGVTTTPSPKFQDARSMLSSGSGSSRTIVMNARDNISAQSPPAGGPPVDEWVVAGSTKKGKNVPVTPSSGATPAGSLTRNDSNRGSSDALNTRGGSGGTVGGMFSALSNNKSQSSKMSGSSSKGGNSSSKASSSTGRTVTMTGTSSSSNSNSNSKNNSANSLNTNTNTNTNTKGSSNTNGRNSNSNSTNNNNIKSANNTTSKPDKSRLSLQTPSDSLVIEEDDDIGMSPSALNNGNSLITMNIDYSMPIDKDLLKAIKCILEEFFINQNSEETMIEMRSKCLDTSLRNRLGDVIKYLINCTLEKKMDDRKKFNDFLLLICAPVPIEGETPRTPRSSNIPPLIPINEIQRGLLLFLHDLDEISIDVPFAMTYFANVISILLLSPYLQENGFNLSFLGNIPEENNFSMSIKAHEFLTEILSCIVTNVNNDCDSDADANEGLKKAQSLYQIAGGIELLNKLPPAIDPIEQTMKELADRYQLPFLALTS